MPIEFQWLDDDHAIGLWKFVDSFTWGEYDATITRSDRECACEGPLYSIFDTRQLDEVPDNVLGHLPHLATHRLENERFTVVVGLRVGLGRAVAEIFGRVYGGVRYADSIEEALVIIERDRAGRG